MTYTGSQLPWYIQYKGYAQQLYAKMQQKIVQNFS